MHRTLSACLLGVFWLTALSALPNRPIGHVIPRHTSPWVVMNQRAGFIFAGTVIRVERVPTSHLRELDTVEIAFHVERAVRGARVGQTLAIREWAGLWMTRPRYRIGEHLVLFLYPTSAIGLTSPISADQGRFTVDDQGRVRFSRMQRTWLGGRFPPIQMQDGIPVREFLGQTGGVVGGRP
jgi:hypothetical protein